MWTAKEVAEEFKMAYRTVLNMIRDGRIKAVRVGRGFRIVDEEVERMKREGV